MKYRMIFFLVCCVLWVGCDNSKKETRKLLKGLMYQQIDFDWPKEYVFYDTVIAGKDFTIDTPLKIVIYKDSTSCSSCMNTYLSMGAELMEYAKNNHIFNTDSVSFVVVMSRSRAEMKECFQGKAIPQVVVINDLNKEFKNRNGLNKYTAFLLNKEDKVVAVGDMMTNLRVRDLYIDQINSLLAN